MPWVNCENQGGYLGGVCLNVTADTLMAAEHRGALIAQEFKS